ncbi:MAG TPA: OsmC family protein [Solirubrobacter sp.]|nr:OsmC family protein [Solirubrobacter sp.]
MTQVLERIRSDSAPPYGTLDAIKENPALGIHHFRARDRWSRGGTYPVERLNANPFLHALAAALTTTLVRVAAARDIVLTEVESTLEGTMDVRGCLGLSDDVPSGFASIRASFRLAGDAPADELRAIVEHAQARAAVSDMVNDGVPVEVTVEARCSS